MSLVAALALGGAWAAVGTLRVTAGPPGLAGLSVDALPFAFTAVDAAVVDAELVYTSQSDWAYDERPNPFGAQCPPRYVGKASLAGRIVIHDTPAIRYCSHEEHTRAVGALGAAAWLPWLPGDVMFDPTPGRYRYVHATTDTRQLDRPPAYDMVQVEAEPIIAALRAGHAVSVSLRPDGPDEWTSWRQWWVWHLTFVVLGLLALGEAELAGVRLYAFVRADGGLERTNLTLAHAVLALELLASVFRALACVDEYSFQRYPLAFVSYFLTGPVPLNTLSTVFYLSYFVSAAHSAGLATLNPAQTSVRRAILGCTGATLLLELVGYSVYATLVSAVDLYQLRILAGSVGLPLVVLLASMLAYHFVRQRLRTLPHTLVSRLSRRLRWCNYLAVLSIIVLTPLGWTVHAPERSLPSIATLYLLLTASGYLQCGAFKPVGVSLPRGPLERCWRGLLKALKRCSGRGPNGSHRTSQVDSDSSAHGPSSRSRSPQASSRRGLRTSLSPPGRHRLSIGGSLSANLPKQRSMRRVESARSVLSRTIVPIVPIQRWSGSGRMSRALSSRRSSVGRVFPFSVASQRADAADGADGADAAAPRASEVSAAQPTAEHMSAHLLLGVTPAFLRGFAAEHGLDRPGVPTLEAGRVARRLCENSNGLSVAEQLAKRQYDQYTDMDEPELVAHANLFVSHSQSCDFVKLLDAIDAHIELHGLPPRETFVWLDVMSIRQSDVSGEVRWIGEVERLVGRVVMVLDPWDKPVCLTRVWCLFELQFAAVHEDDIELSLALAPSERAGFVRALQRERSRVDKALSSFDARLAEASLEDDRRKILQLIESSFGGVGHDPYEEFNARVRKALHAALVAHSWQLDF